MTEKKKFDLAIWRYGIISPLLHRDANGALVGEVLYRIVSQTYIRPDGRQVTLNEETVRKWLYRYKNNGFPGLEDKTRSDEGKFEIPNELADALFDLRKQHPRWTTAQMIRRLAEKGIWNGKKPSRSSLYRFTRAHNLSRDPHLETHPVVKPFAFDHFGQLWVADFMHGPKFWNGPKKKKKSYLHVILDDATRYIVQGGFYSSESVETLLTDLMAATRRYGIPQRFYTDNGPSYASRHLKIACARCGINLVHTPPYKPQGRGKVERFFRTVRDQFLPLKRYKTIQEINEGFQQWLPKYHDQIHSTLGMSPLKKRTMVDNQCRELPEFSDIESLFRMERRCRVYSDGTIQYKKKKYEVPGEMPNSRVTIYFMPWGNPTIYYGDDMRKAKPVDRSDNARRFDHPN